MAESAATTRKQANSLDEIQRKLDVVMQVGGNESAAAGYPAQYQAMREFPTQIKAKVLAASGAAAGPNYVVPVTDDDVKTYRQKEKMIEQVRFDNWVSNNYTPWADPATAQWLQDIYPEYFEARQQENEAHHDIQKQFTDVMIRGPKTKQDLYLLYKVSQDGDVFNRVTGAISAMPQVSPMNPSNILYDQIMHRRDATANNVMRTTVAPRPQGQAAPALEAPNYGLGWNFRTMRHPAVVAPAVGGGGGGAPPANRPPLPAPIPPGIFGGPAPNGFPAQQ